jgi:PilZ domain
MSDIDRRAAERFPVTRDTACTFVSPVVENFGAGRIKNISMEGIGLLLSRPVEPGTLLAVTVSNPAKQFAKTLVVRVAHATGQPGAYLVGGTFQSPLTYQELTALVM